MSPEIALDYAVQHDGLVTNVDDDTDETTRLHLPG